jgi:hypothetical protein
MINTTTFNTLVDAIAGTELVYTKSSKTTQIALLGQLNKLERQAVKEASENSNLSPSAVKLALWSAVAKKVAKFQEVDGTSELSDVDAATSEMTIN